jgi:hypothetical protein
MDSDCGTSDSEKDSDSFDERWGECPEADRGSGVPAVEGEVFQVFSTPDRDGGYVGVRRVRGEEEKAEGSAFRAKCRRFTTRGLGCGDVGRVFMGKSLVYSVGEDQKFDVLRLALQGSRTRGEARLARRNFENNRMSLTVGRGVVSMSMCVRHDRIRGNIDPSALALGVVDWTQALVERRFWTGAKLSEVADIASGFFGFPFASAGELIEMLGGSYEPWSWIPVNRFIRGYEDTIERILHGSVVRVITGSPKSGMIAYARALFKGHQRSITVVDSAGHEVPVVRKKIVFDNSQCLDTQKLCEILRRAPVASGLDVVFCGDPAGSCFSPRPGRPFLAMLELSERFQRVDLPTAEHGYFDEIERGEIPSEIKIAEDLKSLKVLITRLGGKWYVFDSEDGESSALCSVCTPKLFGVSRDWQMGRKDFKKGDFGTIVRVSPKWSRRRLRTVLGCVQSRFVLFCTRGVISRVVCRNDDVCIRQNIFGLTE